jgi:site-specific recombinase XerD
MQTLPAVLTRDYTPLRQLVLDAVSSPLSRVMYAKALDDFFAWREEAGAPPFTRALVQAYRAHLEGQGYASSSINQRLSAIRKLAKEAAANGLLANEVASGITQVAGPKQRGVRMGNWLTGAQSQALLDAPSPDTLKGKRDRAALGLLIGCGLRRSECTAVTVEHIQQREGRWVIVDLIGKGGRLRSVPVPAGVKHRIDTWTTAAGITTGAILRSLNRHGQITGTTLSDGAVLDLVSEYSAVRPHDLRRTCAKLCRKAGGELEQVQLLLGHASISTTERYLGSQQNLENAPNDRLPLAFL